jgi:hypothetical protein
MDRLYNENYVKETEWGRVECFHLGQDTDQQKTVVNIEAMAYEAL